ncbi:hypothetical protein [Herbihabitans rhizosphaerae]|nr:hypothetical protein [Herbihabitans rhizosphaerae]
MSIRRGRHAIVRVRTADGRPVQHLVDGQRLTFEARAGIGYRARITGE